MRIWRCLVGDPIEPWRDSKQAGDVGSMINLRNAYVDTMSLNTGAERCVPFLRGVSNALNFKVGRLYYSDHLQETDTLHRSVEWIVRDLRVTDYHVYLSDYRDDHNERALLPTTLTHASVRATAEYLYAEVRTTY